ncbi:MAG: hypothetical protein AAGB93_08140 [Planctomycetota bacterium]
MTLLPACAGSAISSGASKASTPRMSLRHGAGPEYARIASQTVSPIVIALAAAAIDFGIEALASAMTKSAESYEVKTRAKRAVLLGVDVNDNSWIRTRTMARQDVFAIVRVSSVPKDSTDGLQVIPPKGDSSFEGWRATEPARELVAPMIEALRVRPAQDDASASQAAWPRSADYIESASKLVLRALYDVAPKENDPKTIVVLSFAGVVDGTQPQVDFPLSDGNAGNEQGFQLALRCYTYPVLFKRQGRRATSNKDAKSVKALLSLTLDAPAGHSGDHALAYETTAVFQVEPGFGESGDLAPWKAGVDGAGWLMRTSDASAAPPTRLINASAQILETNNIKKTLEAIGKLTGKVKLKPADLGIE